MDSNSAIQAIQTYCNSHSIQITPDAIERVGRFYTLLAEKNLQINLTRRETIDEFCELDLRELFVFLQHMPVDKSRSFVDIGTGAGIPGLLLGCIEPEAEITLVDSVLKKTDFHQQVIQNLLLKSTKSIHARAEELAHQKKHREQYDLVMARALASRTACMELCGAFAKTNGYLVLFRSDEYLKEVSSHAEDCMGLSLESVKTYRLSGRNAPNFLEIYKKTSHTENKYPRKPVQIKKRPL